MFLENLRNYVIVNASTITYNGYGAGIRIYSGAGKFAVFTRRAKLSGALYCNRSCRLSVGLCVCLWVCYHDNSKLHASMFTKLGL